MLSSYYFACLSYTGFVLQHTVAYQVLTDMLQYVVIQSQYKRGRQSSRKTTYSNMQLIMLKAYMCVCVCITIANCQEVICVLYNTITTTKEMCVHASQAIGHTRTHTHTYTHTHMHCRQDLLSLTLINSSNF